MKRSGVHPAARAELLEARDYYEAQWPGLGREFVSEFEAASRFLLEYPHLSTLERGKLRRWPLRRFPYSIFYAVPPYGI